MSRGGKRDGAGRKRDSAKPTEPMVTIRIPERIAAEVTAFAEEKGGVVVSEPRRRRRSSDRRPESKASICNVRMSKSEQELLRQKAIEAGFGSLQDYLYSRVRQAVGDAAPASPAPQAAAAEVAQQEEAIA